MSDVPHSDIREVKSRLSNIEAQLNQNATNHAVLVNEIKHLRENLPGQVNAAVIAHLSSKDKEGREVSSWWIALVAIVFTALFGFSNLAFLIWG